MVVDLLDDGYEVLGLDDLAQLDPGRPEEGELVDWFYEDLLNSNKNTSLAYRILSCSLKTRP